MATSMVNESIRPLYTTIAYEAAEAGHARNLRIQLIRRQERITRVRVRVMDKVRYERPYLPQSSWARDRGIWENTESDPDRAVSPLAEPRSPRTLRAEALMAMHPLNLRGQPPPPWAEEILRRYPSPPRT